jgi:predicted nucleic acid-binding protein
MNAVDTNILIYVNDPRDLDSLFHWDSMVIAACLEANVETLYTEDFGYSDIDGLKIVNPIKNP